SSAAQTTGFDPEHAPVWHVSVRVQALPSLHAVPSAATGLVHAAVLGLQTPATWHWSEAAQITGLDAVPVPAWQATVRVQALPSLQAVPSATAGLVHAPVLGSQAPATWHWSVAVQEMSVWVQPPALQASMVHGLPSSQPLPQAPQLVRLVVRSVSQPL